MRKLLEKVKNINEKIVIALVCISGAMVLGVLGVCSSSRVYEVGLTIFSIVFASIASWILSTLRCDSKYRVSERRIAKAIDNICKASIDSLNADIEHYQQYDEFQNKLYTYKTQVIAIKDTAYGIGIDYTKMELYDEHNDKQKEVVKNLKKAVY